MIIAWIEDDAAVIKNVFYDLESEGAVIDNYCSISDADDAVEKVMRADVIVLDMIVSPGPKFEASRYPGLGACEKLPIPTHQD